VAIVVSGFSSGLNPVCVCLRITTGNHCFPPIISGQRLSSCSARDGTLPTGLRPHAERQLYRCVNLHVGPMSRTRTINVLITVVVRNPQLGTLVSFFYPDVVDYHIGLANAGEFLNLLPYAMGFLPSIKTITLNRFQSA